MVIYSKKDGLLVLVYEWYIINNICVIYGKIL